MVSTMNSIRRFFRSEVVRRTYLLLMMVLFAAVYVWQIGYGQDTTKTATTVSEPQHFVPFSLFSDPKYTPMEIIALISVLGIAIAGLLYALLLVRQVYKADSGTDKMKEIAAAVREGANAYLGAQFKRIGPLIIVITLLLFVTYTGSVDAFRWGRAFAFLVGALFSWTVGF